MSIGYNLLYKAIVLVGVFVTMSILFYHINYSPPKYVTHATILTFHHRYREKNTQGSEFPKIAYFISIAQKQMENGIQLLDRIMDPFNYYGMHLSKGMGQDEYEWGLWLLSKQNQSYSNIFLLERYFTTQGGISEVDVEVMGMAFMLEKFQDWEFFLSLSTQDYPLLPQYSIREVLRRVPGEFSFLTTWPSECYDVDYRTQIIRYDAALQVDSQGFFKTKIQRPRHNENFLLYKGSTRHILSRQLVKYTVHSTDGYARRLLLFCTNLYQPIEHYFQTLICNHPEFQKKIINEDWYYAKNNKTSSLVKQSPALTNQEELYFAFQSGKIFARKQLIAQSEEMLDLIDKFLLEGCIELLITGTEGEESVEVKLRDVENNIHGQMNKIVQLNQTCGNVEQQLQRTGQTCDA